MNHQFEPEGVHNLTPEQIARGQSDPPWNEKPKWICKNCGTSRWWTMRFGTVYKLRTNVLAHWNMPACDPSLLTKPEVTGWPVVKAFKMQKETAR